MTLDEFKISRTGTAIRAIITAPHSIERMIEVSHRARPAVEAVGAEIGDAVAELDDTERKLVGRWVKELLAPRGWVPDRKGRVAAGRLFNRGTIYRPEGRTTPDGRAAARLKAVRELVATLPFKPMSVDEFIADRHRASEQDE
jgi:hypothetical protein